MIATRLHAKRLSSLTLNRPSLTSIHSTAIHHTNQQQCKRSWRPSEDIRNVDSDNNDDDTDDYNNRMHESIKLKFINRSSDAAQAQIRSSHSRYERMQAPILSFDDEGDIPVPATKHKNILSPDGTPLPDSRDNLSVSKSGGDSASIEQTRKEKFRQALRSVSKVAFSQLGLGGLVLGYVILGGLIFDAIESRYELERLQEKERNRQHFVDQLYTHAYKEFNRVLNQTFELKYALWRGGLSRHDERNEGWQLDVEKDLWKRLVDDELLKYFGAEEKNQVGVEQQQEQNTVQVWTFSSAMLYSATVITTIGYGNITPKTTEGKIATMIYAMIGIPLMFMCLTYTGDLLADAFISGYSKMVNFICRQICRGQLKNCLPDDTRRSFEQPDSESEESRHVPIVATLAVLALYIAMGALLFAQWENWHVLDGAYFCFITFTTIGFGDLVPGKGTVTESKAGKAAMCALFLLFGMIVMAMSFKLMQDELISKFRRFGRRFGFIKRNMNDPG
ncbi:unnamed protein product [Rotaria socialis]|uniref:Potassium channel domain-containing protein n=1 Tax=Rotaria socialis TaxID=392032 RepID=A0A820BSV9_9BILA|nr:unnamed protein product [Rotaria socialis]CAF3386938.1 unnamed protein product [Rotaria socialis]CAF3627352.1 unnamed protein product [Rotaria socialis]CAF3656945.1 unnamed protein product [Rotaria socialis]CAF4180545.1 unnamed protein product [Rotaria socialis]